MSGTNDAQLSYKNEPRKNISSGEDVILAKDLTLDETAALEECNSWDEAVNEWECWYA